MSNGNGHHWSKFWWDDWQNDPDLKLCSLQAQAVWMRILCMMFNQNGYLLVNGLPPTERQIATITSIPERQIKRYLPELLRHNVARKTNAGVIYCQRMANDFKASAIGKEAAAKRWNGHEPSGSPSGEPITEPNDQPIEEPISQAYRPPIPEPIGTRSLEAQKEPPRSPPRGAARRRNPRNAAHEMAREMDAQIAAASRTIDGNAKDVIEFNAFFQQRKAIAHG